MAKSKRTIENVSADLTALKERIADRAPTAEEQAELTDLTNELAALQPPEKPKSNLVAVTISVDGFHYAGVPVKKGKTLNVTAATAENLRAAGVASRPPVAKATAPAERK